VSRLYRKIGSWLGLLAILMATLAPTITHTLAARGNVSALSGAYCGTPSNAAMPFMPFMPFMAPMPADTYYAASDVSGAHGNTHQHSQHTQHAAMSDGDACGYCSLLAHMPVMPSVEGLFIVAVRALQHIVATRFESVRRVEPLTFAQPRAPPFPS